MKVQSCVTILNDVLFLNKEQFGFETKTHFSARFATNLEIYNHGQKI